MVYLTDKRFQLLYRYDIELVKPVYQHINIFDDRGFYSRRDHVIVDFKVTPDPFGMGSGLTFIVCELAPQSLSHQHDCSDNHPASELCALYCCNRVVYKVV